MYHIELEIPASTARTSPAEASLRVGAGSLRRVLIGFKPGALGRASVVLWNRGVQLEPANPLGSFGWDGYIFDFETEHIITPGANLITAKGWNSDTTNPHTVDIWLEVVQIPAETTESLLRRLLRALVGE